MILILFAVFFFLLLISVPIGISISITSLIPYFLQPSFAASSGYIFRNLVSGIDSYVLLAIPLFILSGNLMAKGGISERIFNFFAYFIGNKTGGLPTAVIISCLFYGAISGSGPATVAAVGAMTIPYLTKLGYDQKFVVAMVATAGGLGVIIPPSIPFVAYGLSSGQSVGDLFIAGVFPGLLIGLCLIIYSYYHCRKHGEDKEKLEQAHHQLRAKGFFQLFKYSFFALLAPVIILGGIYGGIVTPTEAADISVVYAFVVSFFIYRSLKLTDLKEIFRDTIRSSVPMLMIASAATVFGRVLTLLQAPQNIAAAITGTISSPLLILLIINIFLLFVGMIMDAMSAILILTPIFLPIIIAIGMDPIHFGVIMVVNLAIGFVTPPVGVNLYVASTMFKLPITEVSRRALPFVGAFIFALLLITYIPAISLILIP